jgi:Holliday junction resolvase RusA-like endonuclease
VETRSKVYVIPGNPIPLARPRFANGHVYDCQSGEKRVVATNLRFMNNGELLEGPLEVSIKFFMPHKTKKPGSWHSVRPDLDNMVKFYLDVAIGILYEDDKQIAKITAEKVYDTNSRTEITLTQI